MCFSLSLLPELALTLPSQVSNQPVGVEGILRRHAPAHDGIEEGFPLASVEPQDLVVRRNSFSLILLLYFSNLHMHM